MELRNFSLLGKSITISFCDFLRQTHDLEYKEGFLWTTWQINDVSAVTFISIGSAVNISSTWASPWNTLATYRTLCLFFSQFWLASTTDSLARGLRSQSKRPLPCLLYCTSLSTAQHGWPRYAVAFGLSENAAVLWKHRTRLAQVLPST